MTLSLDKPDETWDFVSQCLDDFLAEWHAGESPPTLEGFLPTDPAWLRQLALVELVKLDMEQRKDKGCFQELEHYGKQYPELLLEDQFPDDIIYEEYHILKAAGDAVSISDYLERFPVQAEQIQQLMELNDCTAARPRSNAWEDIKVGETIEEFELLLELGRGAFARVFLARQATMQRLVAVKISANRGREAQTLAQLEHPNIVRVFDQRTLPDQELRLLYMELALGGTLLHVIHTLVATPDTLANGRMLNGCVDAAVEATGFGSVVEQHTISDDASWSETVCHIGIQLADALDYAHSKGVFHRDIKPANVLLTTTGRAKLADFNVSSQVGDASSANDAYFGGSLAYMSPEQLEACDKSSEKGPEAVDARSDIYSLGVMLWELVEGYRPFETPISDTWSETLNQMMDERQSPPRLPWRLDDDCHSCLSLVIDRCLQIDPQQRFQDAKSLGYHLKIAADSTMRKLVVPPEKSPLKQALRWPLLSFALVTLSPNIIAAIFNYRFNDSMIQREIGDAWQTFFHIQLTINSIAFPVGLIVCYLVFRPVQRAMRDVRASQPVTAGSKVRSRLLILGDAAAIVSVTEWCLCGILYPTLLWSLGPEVPWWIFPQFVVSLLICGLIAAAYPFFAANFLATRVYYPTLMHFGGVETKEHERVKGLVKRSGVYLMIAAGVPLIGLLAIIPLMDKATLVTLVLAGLLGLAFAFRLHQLLQSHWQAILRLIETD